MIRTARYVGMKNSFPMFRQWAASINRYYLLVNKKPGSAGDGENVFPGYSLRPMDDADMSSLVEIGREATPEDRKEIGIQERFFESGIRGGYALVDDKGRLAAVQWLLTAEDNPVLRRRFRGVFPEIQKGQAFLENVFVLPKFRGRGLLTGISARLLSRAAANGSKVVFSIVRCDRFPVLNELVPMGFRIHRMFREIRFLGTRRRSF